MTTKTWLLALLSTALVSIVATMAAQRALDDETPLPGIPVTVRSAVLGEDREVFVRLPEGYDAQGTVRYPVLYVLDGASQFGHTADSAGLLERLGVIPPLIIVGVPSVNGETRNRDYTPPEMRLDADAPTSPTGSADRFLSFLQTELVDRIDREFRTTRPRMLAGWSRGGLFVVYSQVAAPDVFDARIAHSPALWRDNELIIGKLEEALTVRAPPTGYLYFSLGDRENEMMTASFERAVSVLERQAPATLRWRADLTTGGEHQSNPALSTPAGLCAMFRLDQPCRGPGIRVLVEESGPAPKPIGPRALVEPGASPK